jgi:hypothetical protein
MGTTIIKDLDLLERVAKRIGCTTERDTEVHSAWAGERKSAMTLRKNGGEAGVVNAGKEGEYQIQMDNYQNPICKFIGEDGKLLTRDYMVEMAHEQAALLGGTIIEETVSADGYTEISINVA